MKFLFVVLLIAGCSSSSKLNIEGGEKFYSKSGNFSGIDYIMITKKKHNNKDYVIIIDCNHYITGLGKTFYMRKEMFTSSGKYLSTQPFIRDTSMLYNLQYQMLNPNQFTSLSNEEYEAIKAAYLKYTELTRKYNLDINNLKNYLGWCEVKPITR